MTLSTLYEEDETTSTITSTSYFTLTSSSTMTTATSSNPTQSTTSVVALTAAANYSTLSSIRRVNLNSTGSTDSSATTIGLAIGIPFGILALFVIAFSVWFLLKKRKFANLRKKNLQYGDFDNQLEQTLTANFERFKQLKFFERNPPTKKIPDTKREEEMISYLEGPGKQLNVQRTFFRKSFLNKQMEVDQETPSLPSPYVSKLSGFISPMILKKFNLCGTPTSEESPKELQNRNNSSLRVGMNDSIHPSKKPLPFPPVVNTYKPSSLHNMENTMDSDSFKDRMDSLQDQSICTVIRAYEKGLDDEVNLVVGEKVKILRSHSDGWCLVRKEDNTKGMAPKLCLRYKSSSLAVK